MCCALRQLPVTDFMSDHPFGGMSERGSSSPHRRMEDTFSLRQALPPREPSREQIELAQHLLSHSQDSRNNQQKQNSQTVRDSPSPNYELQSPEAGSPSTERMRQLTPRSNSIERSQRENSQSYAPAASSQTDSAPSGQVCR
jgi:hypothetical protein